MQLIKQEVREEIKGQDISAAEKKEIFDAFHALENKILKIKTTIEKN